MYFRTAAIIAVMFAGPVLIGCANTDIAIAHPPSTEAKTVKVTVSGRWPADSPASVRKRACTAALAECGDTCPPPNLVAPTGAASDIIGYLDKLPNHSFAWSGTCEQAKEDCCRS